MGSHPQITSLSNGELVIVWDESRVTGNKVNKRIGIERRNAAGKNEGKEYITGENSNTGFPVVASLNESSVVVAYSNKKEDKNFVNYQIIRLR